MLVVIGPVTGTATAVPWSAMVCGEFDVLLTTEICPKCTLLTQILGLFGSACPHKTSGENVTEAVQLDPGVIEPPHVSVTAKSPTALVATPVAVASPVFVSVNTSGELTVPTV